MNPDLEDFLEDAFASVKPTSPAIGRVVVEPEYENQLPRPGDANQLRDELARLIKEQSPDPAGLSSHEGVEISIPDAYPLLSKVVRRIILHADKAEGPWVEVEPPGNWI
ncbi:MAG: hypothetical protein JO108_25420 [Acidobacteriaceae bacterium]|nr:hypothetical protein [Acidobacteriaceae bacterium]